MVSLALRAADLFLPVVLLQVRPAGLCFQRCDTSVGVRRRDEDAGIIVLKDYKGAGRGFQLFSSSALLLARIGVKHLNAEGCSAFTCMDYQAYLSDTWADCCCGLLQVRSFGITVN